MTEPSGPPNQWVIDAISSWKKGQAALARELYARGVISTDSRSIVSMMTKTRGVSWDEAVAISEITGHPLPPISGAIPADLAAAFARIPPEAQDHILAVLNLAIAGAQQAYGGQPEGTADDQE